MGTFPQEKEKKFMARQNFGGFGGGANMQQLMRQAQKMQQQMQEAQEQLDAAEYEATSGGGMVSVKVSGKRELTSITIDPQVVDPDDIEMLQDLIMAAVNEALRKGEEARETTMGRMAPGMGGLF
jgi:hypothetical protein